MKKNILLFLFGIVILFGINLLFSYDDIFNLLVVNIVYFMFINSFSHIKYEKKESFLSYFIIIIFISFIYCFISVLIGNLLFKNIRDMFFIMGICIFIIPCINLFKNTMSIKKKRIINIVMVVMFFISFIISVLLFKLFNINLNIFIGIIYMSNLFILIPVIIFNRKLFSKKNINILRAVSKLSYNSQYTLIKLSNLFFYYLSLLFLYFTLTKIYLYNEKTVTTVLVDVYFYLYYIIIFLSVVMYPRDTQDNINKLFINLIRRVLPFLILLSVISGSVLLILFNNYHNAYIFSMLIFEVLFIIMYNMAVGKLVHKKIFIYVLLVGIMLKIILTIPLINSFYRMGYSMIYGDIISSIISMFVVIIITIVYFNKIYKSEFSEYFGSLLSVIYENVILTLILVLLQFFISVRPNNYLHAIMIVFIYTTVFLSYYKIKNKIR